MRWDDLFDSLDARFEELLDAAEDTEQADRARVAFGAVAATERLTGAVGRTVRLRLSQDRQVSGRLARVGPDFVLLRESASVELLVSWAAVAAVEGLSRRTGAPLGTVDHRFDLRKAIRSIARDRAAVTVHTRQGTEISGTVDRVGADFFEVATHAAWENRRAAAVQGVVLVPVAAVAVVRSARLA